MDLEPDIQVEDLVGIDAATLKLARVVPNMEKGVFSPDVNQCYINNIYLDLVKNVRILDGKDAKPVIKFFMEIIVIHSLGLVGDRDFILCLMSQTNGLLLKVFGQAIQLQWGCCVLLKHIVV